MSKHQYVKNADLIDALRICKIEKKEGRTESTKYKRAYNIVGVATLMIATNLVKRPNFSNYPPQIKEEMISDAVENVCLYIDNFDVDYVGLKSGQVNPFGYITQICWYAFIRRITREKKQLKLKAMLIQQSGIIDSIDTRQEGDDTQYANEYLEVLKSYQDYMNDDPVPEATTKKPAKKKQVSKEEYVGGLADLLDDGDEDEPEETTS